MMKLKGAAKALQEDGSIDAAIGRYKARIKKMEDDLAIAEDLGNEEQVRTDIGGLGMRSMSGGSRVWSL